MRIDHIALQVNDIKESVEYYKDYGASVIHQDDTWAFLQFDNIKLALVIEDEHPYHIAFEVDMLPHTVITQSKSYNIQIQRNILLKNITEEKTSNGR